MIATPLNWIVRPVVLRQFIWFVFLAFLRIIARKARSFPARPKTMGQEMTKIPGRSRDVASPVLSEFQSVLEFVRDGTSPDEKPLFVDLLRRSITIRRLVTDDIFLDVALRKYFPSCSV